MDHHKSFHILLANFGGTFCNLIKYILWVLLLEKEPNANVLFYYRNKKELNDHPNYIRLEAMNDLVEKNIFYKLFEYPTGCSEQCLFHSENKITLSHPQAIPLELLPPCFSNASTFYSSSIENNTISMSALVETKLLENPLFPLIRKEFSRIITTYLKMKPSLKERIEEDLSTLRKMREEGKNIMALILRSSQHGIISESTILQTLNQYARAYDVILLTTQVQKFHTLITNTYGKKVLSFNRKRHALDEDWKKDVTDEEFEEEVRMAIVDVYLCSQCDFIVSPISNMLLGSLFFNPSLPFATLTE